MKRSGKSLDEKKINELCSQITFDEENREMTIPGELGEILMKETGLKSVEEAVHKILKEQLDTLNVEVKKEKKKHGKAKKQVRRRRSGVQSAGKNKKVH